MLDCYYFKHSCISTHTHMGLKHVKFTCNVIFFSHKHQERKMTQTPGGKHSCVCRSIYQGCSCAPTCSPPPHLLSHMLGHTPLQVFPSFSSHTHGCKNKTQFLILTGVDCRRACVPVTKQCTCPLSENFCHSGDASLTTCVRTTQLWQKWRQINAMMTPHVSISAPPASESANME